MLPVLLHPKHIFGYNQNTTDNLWFVSQQNLVYVVGAVAVLYHLDQQSERFISNVGRNREVQVIVVSPNHQWLGVAELSYDRAQMCVSIYDVISLKKKKTLGIPGATTKVRQQPQGGDPNIASATGGKSSIRENQRFVNLAFSHDSKFVISQIGDPDWTLTYWEWESNKMIASISFAPNGANAFAPIYQVAFHPHDDAQISVVGANGCFLVLLEEGGILKLAGEHRNCENANYYCHAWVSDSRILAGSDGGRIVLLEGGEEQHQFNILKEMPEEVSWPQFDTVDEDLPVNDSSLETGAVNKIVGFSKGFVCSCNSDKVYLFERYAGGKVYRQSAIIKIPSESTITNVPESCHIIALAVSPSEDMLAIATANRRLYAFTLTTVDINKGMGLAFEPLSPHFHCGDVRDIDVCCRKPIAVTCASDRTLSVWNYATNQQQLFKCLDDDVFSVTLHPTGLYLLAGCATKLRLMGLMIDDVRIVHEFSIKECHACAFSHGGHLIAALQGTNVIQVYSTVTFDGLATFKGHVGRVMSIAWTYDDLKLVSCASDGTVFEWDVHSSKRTNEVMVGTGCLCSGVDVARDNCTMFSVGSDDTVREIAESQVLGQVSLHASPTSASPLTSVAVLHCGKALFVSSSQGSVWMVPVPLTCPEDCQEFQPISKDVVKMKLTSDDKWLITISSDGSVFIWKVTDKDGHPLQSDEDLPFLEEILITRADLEEKNLAICELSQQVKDIKGQMDQQKRAAEAVHTEDLKKQADTFQEQISALEANLLLSKSENIKMMETFKETIIKTNEEHRRLVEKIQSETHQKLVLEYKKYHELQISEQKLCLDFRQQLEQTKQERISMMSEIQAQYKSQLEEMNQKFLNAKEELEENKIKADKTIRLIEEDADQEIQELKANYENQILTEKVVSTKVKADLGILKKKLISLQKEVDEQIEEIRRGNAEQHKLKNNIEELQNDIQTMRREIEERDHMLFTKEKLHCKLKLKSDKMEHLNSVLELKIHEMDRQAERQVQNIKLLTSELDEVKTQLESFAQANKDLKYENSNLKQKLQVTSHSLRVEQCKVQDTNTTLKNFKFEVGNLLFVLHDSKRLKQHVGNLCKKYEITSL